MNKKIISTPQLIPAMDCIEFPENSWEYLTHSLLTPRQQELLTLSLSYYSTLVSNPEAYEALMIKISDIATLIGQRIPNIRSVFGVGHPFYGNINFKIRIYNTLLDLHEGRRALSPEQIDYILLPDIDLMLVYDLAVNTSPPLFCSTADLKDVFVKESTLNLRQWGPLLRDLTNLYEIADRDESPVTEFERHGRLHVDLFPIPASLLRQTVDELSLDTIGRIIFLRDVMFTCEPLYEDKQTDATQHIHAIRNKMALLLKKAYPSAPSVDALLSIQPHRNFIHAYQPVIDTLSKRWEPYLLGFHTKKEY